MGNGVVDGTSKVLIHSLPCEDCESKEVTGSEPDVALVCRRNGPVVRKTEFRLQGLRCQCFRPRQLGTSGNNSQEPLDG